MGGIDFAMIRRIVRYLAMEHGRLRGVWFRLCRPRNDEYAAFLRRHGGLHEMGEDCRVNLDTTITDPGYVRIGDNVTLSSCTLVGHDGSIGVIGRATGLKLDAVGRIDIRDNVFIGMGAIVLPGVTIGPDAVVGAGSIVCRDVPPGSVVAGNPARHICSWEELAAKFERRTASYPWSELIRTREGDYDPAIEPELQRLRRAHFYPAPAAGLRSTEAPLAGSLEDRAEGGAARDLGLRPSVSTT